MSNGSYLFSMTGSTSMRVSSSSLSRTVLNKVADPGSEVVNEMSKFLDSL